MLKDFLKTVSTRSEYVALGLVATGITAGTTAIILIHGEFINPEDAPLTALALLPITLPFFAGAATVVALKQTIDIALDLIDD